jgi:hypothetical protein
LLHPDCYKEPECDPPGWGPSHGGPIVGCQLIPSSVSPRLPHLTHVAFSAPSTSAFLVAYCYTLRCILKGFANCSGDSKSLESAGVVRHRFPNPVDLGLSPRAQRKAVLPRAHLGCTSVPTANPDIREVQHSCGLKRNYFCTLPLRATSAPKGPGLRA